MTINKYFITILLSISFLNISSILQSENTLAATGDISGVRSFSATPGNQSVHLLWENPQDPNYAGTLIVRSNNQISWTPTDGIENYHVNDEVTNNVKIVYYSTGTEYDDLQLENNTEYVYQAFTYNYDAKYSGGSNQIS